MQEEDKFRKMTIINKEGLPAQINSQTITQQIGKDTLRDLFDFAEEMERREKARTVISAKQEPSVKTER